MTHHGSPCWYELSTAPGKLAEAGDFYAKALGWTFADAGMEGFTYHLASVGGEMVAAGATLHRPVAPIPGTGRFAILADPTGAGFGILEPAPMPGGGGGTAFDQSKAGHGNWNELSTGDQKAAMAFYGKVLGWKPGQSMDMGAMGSYDLFRWQDRDIGGMMGLAPDMPGAAWLPYFGANGIAPAMERIRAAGGTILHGPQEVPGGAFIAQARDPQGARFAVVGPMEHTP